MPTKAPQIAIVHDWLVKHRGGEKVLDAILELYPSAEVLTLFYDRDSFVGRVGEHRIQASWLNRVPLIRHIYRVLLPILPYAAESLDLSEYDLVISVSHCVAKGVITRPGANHLCYCLTPARYAWDLQSDYFPNRFVRALATPFLSFFRQWDEYNSRRVDAFATTSTWVAKRIYHSYRREALVIPAFADLDLYRPISGDRGHYYLIVSALVPYKRIDIAIEACEMLGRNLFVVGSGPEAKKLRALGRTQTKFLGHVSDEDLRELYAGAKALLFPGVEDFGIVPIEAAACGTPTIALAAGGALDTVIEGETGHLFQEQSVDGLKDAILAFELITFQPETCRNQAMKYSRESFQDRFADFVSSALAEDSLETQSPDAENPV